MSELSCDTLFIGRNETHDLSRYLKQISYINTRITNTCRRGVQAGEVEIRAQSGD